MMGFIVFCILAGGGGSFVFWAMRQSARNPELAEQARRRRTRYRRGDGFDATFGDGMDDSSSAAVADSLMRMADRYENAGDTQSAEQARTAAEQARSREDGADASQAAQEYLASVGAIDVVEAFSSADPVSASSDRSSGSDASSDGGSSSAWSDNS